MLLLATPLTMVAREESHLASSWTPAWAGVSLSLVHPETLSTAEGGRQLAKKLEQGGAAAKTKTQDRVRAWEEKHGKRAVQKLSDEEFLQEAANRANKIRSDKGPRAGMEKHKHAEELVKRYQSLHGQRKHLQVEPRYKDGVPYVPKSGLKGSVKPDVFDPLSNLGSDYKFGEAQMSADQLQRLQANLPKPGGAAATIRVIKPTK